MNKNIQAMSWNEIQANAAAFSKEWSDAAEEKQESQPWLLDFFNVFGVDVRHEVLEQRVTLQDGKGFIDCLWRKKIIVEMKSQGKDLKSAYGQVMEYLHSLPNEDKPKLIMVCNFETCKLYNIDNNIKPITFKVKDLKKYVKHFSEITALYSSEQYESEEIAVNTKAAEKMAKLHDALKESGYDGHELEIYLVRLLFCMFADDTYIFNPDSFSNYIRGTKTDGSDLSDKISRLFEILDITDAEKAKRKNLPDELRKFPYVDGELFTDPLRHADFDSKMRQTLIDCCKFDWQKISPSIFGSMFQGVMDSQKRREIGAHYTSEENILKLIKPLFLDDLRKEFDKVKTNQKQLEAFHDKIANLKILDPACGCGNFLIVSYRELRRLEFDVLKFLYGDKQMSIDFANIIVKVGMEQFFGIEIEDFPCQVARVGMWLVNHQCNLEMQEIFGSSSASLPLLKAATIYHKNALRIDWEDVCKGKPSYIVGNPPYVGYKLQNDTQKEDMRIVIPYAKNLDYVCAWYVYASKFIQSANTKCAFVSTNSIIQGEQVAMLWKPLYENLGVHINFGVTTFKWSNEAKGKAAVHCVIIGFSLQKTENDLNPYLIKTSTTFIERRSKPLCDVPNMIYGSEPREGGHLLIKADEYDEFLSKEPKAVKYIRKFVGSEEYINNIPKYCLWLVGINPSELKNMPLVMERIDRVNKFRQNSKRAGTQSAADSPTLFESIRQPTTEYILVPIISSEKRKYIPIGFVSPDIVVNNAVQIIPNATLYHFGVLTSSVHMAWTRAVCGRLEMRYRYSKDVVYNNFIWADVTDKQKSDIEKAAQGVLDARAKFEGSSLADLYDPLTMPPELFRAHKALDRIVEKAYGVAGKTESEIVAVLMEMYRERAEGK